MRVRNKESGSEGFSGQLNVHSVSEIIVGFDEGDQTSDYISQYDVLIGGEWKDLNQAFKDRDVITDNYDTVFFEPPTPEDRERGFTL